MLTLSDFFPSMQHTLKEGGKENDGTLQCYNFHKRKVLLEKLANIKGIVFTFSLKEMKHK